MVVALVDDVGVYLEDVVEASYHTDSQVEAWVAEEGGSLSVVSVASVEQCTGEVEGHRDLAEALEGHQQKQELAGA